MSGSSAFSKSSLNIWKLLIHILLKPAAAAAKSLQLCLTLCDPIDEATRLLCPWDSPGKNTGVGCHFLLQCMKVKKWKWSRSVLSNSLQPHGRQPTRLLHPWDILGKSTGVGCHCLLQLLKPSLKNFEHYFASTWNEYNCVVVWTFFGIAFLWDQNENWPFPVL